MYIMSKKKKYRATLQPVIALVGIYPKDASIVIRRGICTPAV